MKRPTHKPAAGRRRGNATAWSYTLFYSASGIILALVAYASFILAKPPPQVADAPAKPKLMALIRLGQGDGKGRCRQMAFDNASGRFEEAGSGPCPNLIPAELLVDTIRSRAALADSFTRAFK